MLKLMWQCLLLLLQADKLKSFLARQRGRIESGASKVEWALAWKQLTAERQVMILGLLLKSRPAAAAIISSPATWLPSIPLPLERGNEHMQLE
jgi:hypothetical protein